MTPFIDGILLSKIHEKISENGEDGNDGLQGDKETREYKQVDYIDILISDFELWLLKELVEVILVHHYLLDYIIRCILGCFLTYPMIFMI